MDNCIHSAIAPNMNRCSVCGMVWNGERWGVATEIPALPPRCGSWVVTAPDGRVFELFDKSNVRHAANNGWKIETAIGYLSRINAEIAA